MDQTSDGKSRRARLGQKARAKEKMARARQVQQEAQDRIGKLPPIVSPPKPIASGEK